VWQPHVSLAGIVGKYLILCCGCCVQEETWETAEVILKGIESGWVNPVVAREYTLDEAAQAHHDIIHNSGARGKLVFKL
jgi:NADPH2:quinone reductase